MGIQNERVKVSLLIIFLCSFTTSVQGRSVYAIPTHTAAILNVYDVLEGAQEGQLEYRATYDLKYGGGADAVIDTRSNIIFVTFENRYQFQLVNGRTFQSEGEVAAEGASDLAGLELDYVDQDTTLLYTVDRGTNKLFVYDWDAEAKELTLLPHSDSQPYYTLLPYNPQDDNVFACGLALDEVDDTLYVSQLKRTGSGDFAYSNIVYAYDPNISAPDPNDRFGCTRKIDLGEYEGQKNRNHSISFKEFEQIRECGFGIYTTGFGPGNKFCDIHPSVGGFAIMNIALGFVEYFPDLSLCKSRILPELPEIFRNQAVFQTMLSFCRHDINLS